MDSTIVFKGLGNGFLMKRMEMKVFDTMFSVAKFNYFLITIFPLARKTFCVKTLSFIAYFIFL